MRVAPGGGGAGSSGSGSCPDYDPGCPGFTGGGAGPGGESLYGPGISEGKRLLVFQSPHNRLPQWISLPPGPHDLHFQAGNPIRSSFFDGRLTLSEGDVLVAVCEPVQKRKSPEADLWSLGIIDSEGSVRPVRFAG